MEKRVRLYDKRNLILFVISYVINNFASGVLYDTYINYLHEVAPAISTSFWAFYGYASFISAAILLTVPQLGYRLILIACTLATSAAFFGAVFLKSSFVLYAATLLALTGVQLHYIILAPYVATYTDNLEEEEIKWYTRTYYMGYVGYLLATYLGGIMVVKLFSLLSSISYGAAKEATRFIVDMSPDLYANYLKGNELALIVIGLLSLLALAPLIFIKENKRDFRKEGGEADDRPWRVRVKESFRVLLNKNARVYLAYWTIISFAMGLFTSYYTVFLNRVLHIDKVTSSLLVSISYLAIIVFMFFTPWAVRRFGEVGTIVLTLVLSTPFMIFIARGDSFGQMMIPVVGASLFVRSGLANLSSPAESSLSMGIIPRELRPAYTALVNVLAGLVSVVSGAFTGKILFKNLAGYRQAYYIAAVLYVMAATILWLGLKNVKNEVSHEG